MASGMTRVRALVVDDEPWARDRICSLLSEEPTVEVVGESSCGADAVDAIRALDPHLVFLDVQMPDLDAFDVIAEVGESRMPAVIFVTAYDQHALRAFEVHALDYLLKPFDRGRFREALRRAVALIEAGSSEARARRLEEMLAEVKPQRWLDRLLVREHGRLFFVRVETLDWIEAAGNYVRLHKEGRSHLVRQTMKALERQLDPATFLRIHRSTIVNLDRVQEIQPLFSGEHAVLLADGTRLTLSKSYRDRLQRFRPRRS